MRTLVGQDCPIVELRMGYFSKGGRIGKRLGLDSLAGGCWQSPSVLKEFWAVLSPLNRQPS